MDKKRTRYFTLGFVALLLVVVLLLAWGGLRDTADIVLPQTQDDGSGSGQSSGAESLRVVEITPDTVRPAINTLSRPAVYSRTQTVETFWSGGSGTAVSKVYVSGGRTRIDTQLPDGSVRHMLLSGGAAAVWYDEEETWTTLDAAQLSGDAAQRMLTYETVRDLPVESIDEASYQRLDGVDCIYVSTLEGKDGYADRYWVSVSTGLLHMAERTYNGAVVYRFTASPLSDDPPAEELFLLPDGYGLENREPLT